MSQRRMHYNEDTQQYEPAPKRVRAASDVPTFSSMMQTVRADAASAAKRVHAVLSHSAEIRADLALAHVIATTSVGEKQQKYRAHIETYGDLPHIHVAIYLYDVKSLKTDERLLLLLERAVKYTKESDQSTHDYAGEYSAERTYCFRLPCGGTFSVCAYISTDSETCRKVKTGVTLTESATYALQCD